MNRRRFHLALISGLTALFGRKASQAKTMSTDQRWDLKTNGEILAEVKNKLLQMDRFSLPGKPDGQIYLAFAVIEENPKISPDRAKVNVQIVWDDDTPIPEQFDVSFVYASAPQKLKSGTL